MPDKVSELWDLGDGATVRLHGRVNKVFPTQSGDGQYGPWYRTDLDFSDDTGKVKIGWFHNDSPTPPLQVSGATVKVEGQIKTFRKRDNTQGLGVTGKSVELADVQGGSAHPPPMQGSAPQTGAMGPSGGGRAPQQSTRQGVRTDVEWLAWAREMLGELTTLYRSQVPGRILDAGVDEVEAAILGAAQATLVHLSISMEHGNLTPTLGQQASPGRERAQTAYDRAEEKTFESNPGNFPGTHDGGSSADPADDDDIPFSIILIPMILPLLGGLVGLS